MSEKIFSSLASATQEVFKMMLDIDAVAGEKSSGGPDAAADEITVVIGFLGDVSGRIYYFFPRETALEFVRIMSGMEVSEVDDFVTSAVGEISNIISGNAAIGLSRQEISCDILPPEISVGNAEELQADGAKIFAATIHTTVGDVDLAVKIQQGQKKA